VWPGATCNSSIGHYTVCLTPCKTVGDCKPMPGYQVECTSFGCVLACTGDPQCPPGMICRDTGWCRWP
jgi:hypothetical protein